MAKLNMVKVSTLIRKGYLLAGVIMAANMFVVNEMKAMKDENNNIDNEKIIIPGKKDKDKDALSLEGVLNFVLSWENTINLIGGAVFSGANNYLKWCDYNPGSYWQLGCLGWRSGRHIKDIFQIGINLNLGRGILWLIPGTYNFTKSFTEKDKSSAYVVPLYFSCLVGTRVYGFFNDNDLAGNIALIGVFLLQGLVSAPLAIHISNFSISISLDSMLWAGIGKFLDKTEEKKDYNKEPTGQYPSA